MAWTRAEKARLVRRTFPTISLNSDDVCGSDDADKDSKAARDGANSNTKEDNESLSSGDMLSE